ncbi:hypothetical protein [Frankia sp. Cas3]|uniref:Tc toxin subunit A-related protein n=1 Tax=Frankia sp. Cas3 TaxID=3073926 RepID=UPI002AD4A7BD|nr:hypothetical protein [Frankia sp. Cas3]
MRNPTVPMLHGLLDQEIYFTGTRYRETKELKHFIVQQRDVAYRVQTHYHDYVQVLEDRFRQLGLASLQAADTDYAPDGASLPETVEVTLPAAARVTVAARAGLLLAAATSARLPDGTQVELAASLSVDASAATSVSAPAGLAVTLTDGLTPAPPPGSVLTLAAWPAFLTVDAAVQLPADTAVILYNGSTATLPAGTGALLAGGTDVTVVAGTQATLVRSQPRPVLYAEAVDRYGPTDLVAHPRPVRDLDFSGGGAYAVYNWELFFHAPLAMAIQLSRNQHFADAQRWFHYIFDPTDSSDGPEPERFWKVRPFQTTEVKRVEDILVNLATGADAQLRAETANSIDAWQRAPFRPHVIARYRQQAYMYKTVMAYLDNLIAWGDSLFAQDTGEAVDEALMLYLLAAQILGPRPQAVPAKGTMRPQTYDSLKKDLGKLGTVLREVEADPPYDLFPLPTPAGPVSPAVAAARSLGKALYFGVPRNDKLLGYWDTVADRLFKIRNSLNSQGVFRQLALFEPPIDPALLARAAAAGIDVAAIVNGVNQPLPLVRFAPLLRSAIELAQEVKALAANLLAVIEKEDGEALALLRAKHEGAILQLAEQVKYAQSQEAIKATEGLRGSLQIAMQRYVYYELQLGRTLDQISAAVPTLVDLDRAGLERMKLSAQEGSVPTRTIEVDIARDAFAKAAQALAGGRLLSSNEVREGLLLEGGQLASDIANIISLVSSIGHAVPSVSVHVQPWGLGTTVSYGGSNVGNAAGAIASAARAVAERLNFEARRAARIDAFARRERDWAFQSNLAAGEISQIFKQIRAAQLREAIADLDLRNHREQMKQAAEIETFLNEDGASKTGKNANKALYGYLKREIKGLYAQSFQTAFGVARQAERALGHELGDTSLTFLQYNYLAGKEGLLAGERLMLDLRRMELAYQQLNQREYELTKHVSLLQVAPEALLELRATGRCTFRLDEDLFNLDGPSHYFRRIRNVALSIPCVVGPYTSVNCTLTLVRSTIRVSPAPGAHGYAQEGTEDARLADYYGSLRSVVTSGAQNDSGLFDANLHDERYLPFENSGVISDWQLRLPADPSSGDPAQFDYSTISDVVLHITYTAREGGEALGKSAVSDLKEKIESAKAAGSTRLFSLRHEFPMAWAAYKAAPKVDGDFRPITISLTAQHYPVWSKAGDGFRCEVKSAVLIARGKGSLQLAKPGGTDPQTLGRSVGDLWRVEIADKPQFVGDWGACLTADGVDDAFLLLHWGMIKGV